MLSCLAIVVTVAPAAADPVSVACEPGPGGLRTLVVTADAAALSAREAPGAIVIDVADPGDGLSARSLTCPPARGVQVIPGRVMGLPQTRVVVSLGRETPRIVRADGRIRLLWLPDRVGAAPSVAVPAPTTADAPSPPAAARRPERAAERPERRAKPAERAEEPARRQARARDDRGEERAARRAAPSPPAESPAEPARPAETSADRRAPEPSSHRQGWPEPPVDRAALTAPADRPPAADRAPEPAPPPVSADAGRPAGQAADFLAFPQSVSLEATVATDLRSGAGRRFPSRGEVQPGTRVLVDGRAGDWLRTVSGAWVFGPYFETPGDAFSATVFAARVEAINAPVHAGPGPHHEIVAEVYRGDQVVIDEVKADWAHVRDGGWVKLGHLSRIEEARP